MKKMLLFVSLLTFIIFPLNVFGANVSNVSISGITEKQEGEEFIVNFRVNFSGLEPGYDKTLGIWYVGIALEYDTEVLTVKGISSPNFDSGLYNVEGEYVILGKVIEGYTSKEYCAYNLLYCSDYNVSLKFYINDTDKTSTTIKVTEASAMLLDMVDENKDYHLEDAFEVGDIFDKSHTINIKQATTEVPKEPDNIVKTEKPKIEPPKIETPTPKPTTEKSSNALIKELTITDYELKFYKNTFEYELTIPNNLNKLSLNITLDNEKATYKIIGADDIKGNNDKINIEVTAEDNTKETYTIKIKREEPEEEIVEIPPKENKTKKFIEKYFTKKNLIYLGIVLGIIFIIILIIILFNHRNNKKINKMLDEL